MARQPKVIADIYPLVVIIWRDHTGQLPDTWAKREDLDSIGELDTISSVGWLYSETDEKYVLFGAVSDTAEDFGSIQTIGKDMTLQVKVIRGKMKK